jgi:replicative DNA helicase
VSALCLDYDQGGETADAIAARWGGLLGAVHSTRKHTADAPRFRVILTLSRPVSPFEFAGLWRRVAAVAGAVDVATKDPSRFWYVPGSATGAEFVWLPLEGEPLNPDEWLARPEPTERVATPALDATRDAGDGSDRYERARAYIARMPAAISGSRGHQATWAVACKLVHGFELSDADALAIMRADYNPRCQPPWSEKELQHKVESARKQASKLTARVESRPWTPPREWSRDEAPPEDPPEWALPPDEWSDSDPSNDEGREESDQPLDPIEAAERDAIEKEPQPKREPPRVEPLSMIQLLAPVIEAMREAGKREVLGVPTGIAELDTAIGRYRPGNMTILGAKRSFGKTSFSLVAIDAALRGGHGLLVFAGEDSLQMYGRRFMARRAGLNALLLRDMADPFTEVQMKRAHDALTTAEGEPFFVPAIGMPVEDIVQTIESESKRRKVELVIVDYLQCLRTRRRYPDRRLQITGIVSDLGAAIKNASAHGLLLSQLKRTEHRKPEVEDLKESGDLEDKADHIILGHRERTETTDVRSISVAKNKDGLDDLPDFELDFERLTASFTGRAWEAGQGNGGRPLGRSWSPRDGSPRPAPQPWHEPPERDDPDEPDEYGIPRSL